MNEIHDNGTTVRQVQPRDFSFLSEASQEIVAVMQGLLVGIGAMSVEMGDIHPIILSGLEKTISGSVATITEGYVMYKKRIYHIPSYTGEAGIKYCFNPNLVVVAPSPVKDGDFANTVNCHYNTFGIVAGYTNMSYMAPDYDLYYDNAGWGPVLKRLKDLSA